MSPSNFSYYSQFEGLLYTCKIPDDLKNQLAIESNNQIKNSHSISISQLSHTNAGKFFYF